MDTSYIYCPNCIRRNMSHPRIIMNVITGEYIMTPSTNITATSNETVLEWKCDKCKQYTTIQILKENKNYV